MIFNLCLFCFVFYFEVLLLFFRQHNLFIWIFHHFFCLWMSLPMSCNCFPCIGSCNSWFLFFLFAVYCGLLGILYLLWSYKLIKSLINSTLSLAHPLAVAPLLSYISIRLPKEKSRSNMPVLNNCFFLIWVLQLLKSQSLVRPLQHFSVDSLHMVVHHLTCIDLIWKVECSFYAK